MTSTKLQQPIRPKVFEPDKPEHRQTLASVNFNSYRKLKSIPADLGKKILRKRAISFTIGGGRFAPANKRRKKSDIVRPTKFLLGGNIHDPLNLNSLADEETNRQMNAVTPKSSPLPTPKHRKGEIEVFIPLDINDPLNLKGGADVPLNSPFKKKKNKTKKRKRSSTESSGVPTDEILSITIPKEDAVKDESKVTKEIPKRIRRPSEMDKIVSPVIPQPGQSKTKRLSGYHRSISKEAVPPNTSISYTASQTVGSHPVTSHVTTLSHTVIPTGTVAKVESTFKPKIVVKEGMFQFGNYKQYYGYRNPQQAKDLRLNCLQREWFEDKDVLDIGCNIGHVTLSIARDCHPRFIEGLDIDKSLVCIAKKNVKHYLLRNSDGTNSFPVSMAHMYGPLQIPAMRLQERNSFPHNVQFVQGNYVLDCDELLDLVRPKYDVIVCLSVTKWIHLNWGDAGLKRTFQRMYRHLREGGRLILEPQPWNSYKKKKKLTDGIFENYKSISFYPKQFTQYLLSSEVGFSRCDAITTPEHDSKGFQRPILVFIKETKLLFHPTEHDEQPKILQNSQLQSTPRADADKVEDLQSSQLQATALNTGQNDPVESIQDCQTKLPTANTQQEVVPCRQPELSSDT